MHPTPRFFGRATHGISVTAINRRILPMPTDTTMARDVLQKRAKAIYAAYDKAIAIAAADRAKALNEIWAALEFLDKVDGHG
jgi:predicted solute-binding protein